VYSSLENLGIAVFLSPWHVGYSWSGQCIVSKRDPGGKLVVPVEMGLLNFPSVFTAGTDIYR
jgi:hypothetical protein